jgi:hypothetical protein
MIVKAGLASRLTSSDIRAAEPAYGRPDPNPRPLDREGVDVRSVLEVATWLESFASAAAIPTWC